MTLEYAMYYLHMGCFVAQWSIYLVVLSNVIASVCGYNPKEEVVTQLHVR